MGSIRCPHCHHVLFAFEPQSGLATVPATSPDPSAALLLRVTEAARLLGVSRTTLYQLIAAGEIPVVRIGRSVRIVRSELERRVQSLTAL